MNASIITEDVLGSLQRRFGKCRQIGSGNVYAFGSSLTCSVSYSKLLRGDKYFFAVPRAILLPGDHIPQTDFGEFVLLICGSADSILVLPNPLVAEMLEGVPTRRVDVFREHDSYILQTTKHPKRNVAEFLNAFPVRKESSSQPLEGSDIPAAPERAHVKAQWSLIALGRAEGCKVWVPINDRNLSYQRQPFSALTVGRLPNFGFEENTRRIVENIDVLWLSKNVIRSAFEIEATTSLYSGLLRLNDLVLAQPNNHINLYIAAGTKRRDALRAQLTRPTFQPLITQCRFVSFEEIDGHVERLRTMDLDGETRVTGLIRGEAFELPEHWVYPKVD